MIPIPDCLEKEVAALVEHPQAVMAESDTRLVDLDGKAKGFYKRYKTSGLTDGKKIARAGLFVKNYFRTTSKSFYYSEIFTYKK